MATGSGLDAQIGFGQESTWGTSVTPTRFVEFDSESLKKDVTWQEPKGLRVGVKAKRASRVRQSRIGVTGDVSMDLPTLGAGMLIRNCLGSTTTTTTLISGSAYKQVHVPGDFRGLGLTVQVGRPEPGTGTVKPFTYAGCKVTKWELNIKDNDTPSLKLSFDGRSEATATALATASYLAGTTTYDFSQATVFKLGGTATTASGETTIASGVQVAAIVKDFTLTGTTPFATDRYGLGNAGLKAEQLENGTPTYTGKMTAEFAATELYNLFATNSTVALQLDLVGAVIGATNQTFSIILPAIKIKSAPPNVGGPDIVTMSTDFEVYNDETNPTMQIKIISTESTTV
ncbi:phage tail tube protein [Amycolatopsis sp. NPDC005961]|uniref:phage tail tube protein n=1 Tax=Amycolatopsis sp. NPDC005961 TaxID=3156720 RepID=UPI0033C5CD16